MTGESIQINYIEMPSTDLEKTKQFYSTAFNWSFVDYGPEYCAIQQAGIDGGFFKSEQTAITKNGSVLVVLYSKNLESTYQKVMDCGAQISTEIFQFPGGRRFHFIDPVGNEMAVWSE